MSNLMLIAGVDEVGRGPLAGPVVAAAVILASQTIIPGLNDSKKLTDKQRRALLIPILREAHAVAIGYCTAEEIDKLNIHYATLKAMQQAIDQLAIAPDIVYIDGKFCPSSAYHCEAIIKGDSKIPAIAAASIVAKVFRDQLMIDLDCKYPEYGFAGHKGYPSKLHLEKLIEHGACAIHRRSYRPVAEVVMQYANGELENA
jgi:ribonuclease HII